MASIVGGHESPVEIASTRERNCVSPGLEEGNAESSQELRHHNEAKLSFIAEFFDSGEELRT